MVSTHRYNEYALGAQMDLENQGLDELLQGLHTVRDFVRWGASRFNQAELWYGHGTDNAWDEALTLVLYGLHLPDEAGPELLDARLLDSEKVILLELLRRRIEERIPVPYITGEAWFAGLRFQVDERVLIPRSPVAELIERQFSPWLERNPERILDLCAGCGCLGIACAYAFPDAEIELSDISTDALDVAEQNVAGHGLRERVVVVESDVFAKVKGTYDLIVANPPYVDAEDLAALPEEYHHEPMLALAAGVDGLDITAPPSARSGESSDRRRRTDCRARQFLGASGERVSAGRLQLA